MPRWRYLAAVAVVVVSAVGGDTVGPPPRPADLASYRRHPIDERDQLRAVVAVAAGERPGERDTGCVNEEVVPGLEPVSEPPFRLHMTGVCDRPRPLDLTR